MDELWGDLPASLRDHFLRLMEQFDLSYRTLDNKEISLVVERLPLDPPAFQEPWEAIQRREPCEEITMRFQLNTLPPGIPTWFIARSHRFTTYTHWRLGALFAHHTHDAHDAKHLALVQAFPHENAVRLTVRGPNPQNFFALLKDGIEVTLDRYPGLRIDRLIPCPDPAGTACKHQFEYEHLLRRLHKKPHIECPECWEDIFVPKLLFGLHASTQDQMLVKLEKIETIGAATVGAVQELTALTQRNFAIEYRREQSKIESHCPNVFVLLPHEGHRRLKNPFGQKMSLHLYCQQPGC